MVTWGELSFRNEEGLTLNERWGWSSVFRLAVKGKRALDCIWDHCE